MKIIFLDIDGVLNSTRSVAVKIGPTRETSELVQELYKIYEPEGLGIEYFAEYALRCTDPVCVALVNKLIKKSDAALVLSSSHRSLFFDSIVPRGSDAHLSRLRMYLTAMGLQVPTNFGITPSLHGNRGNEIDTWIKLAHEKQIINGDYEYVILDDSNDMLKEQNLVLINPDQGISFTDYAKACELLAIPNPD